MKVTITFPDEIAKKVCRLPDKDAFITRAVADALAHKSETAGGAPSVAYIGSPRLARPEQASAFEKEVIEEDLDAGL